MIKSLRNFTQLIGLIGILALPYQGFTQGVDDASKKLGAWYMYFGNDALSKKWGLHTEAQYRLYEVVDNQQQLLLRFGVNYYHRPHSMITAGYAYIRTWFFTLPKDVFIGEHRIWQQYIHRTDWLSHFQEHRFRLEQRWITFEDRTRYANRVRYRLFWAIPISSKKLEDNTWFLAFYNEIFLHINEPRTFDQNRLYGALGYQFSKQLNVQAGYLLNSFEPAHFHRIQFAVLWNPKFYR